MNANANANASGADITEPSAAFVSNMNTSRAFPAMASIAEGELEVAAPQGGSTAAVPNAGHYRGAHVEAPWGEVRGGVPGPRVDGGAARTREAQRDIPERYRTVPGGLRGKESVERAYPQHVRFGNVWVDRLRSEDCCGCRADMGMT